MFTSYHIAWLIVSLVIIGTAVLLLKKYKPSLKSILSVACVVSIASELTKVFSMVQIVPSADGSTVYPYLELQHLPFHLCSIQILFIFYARFAKEGKRKTALLAFMYPTCLIGAACALGVPSIFSTSIDASQAFTHPLGYQYFLFHVMLVILGIYIPMSGQVEIRAKHYGSTLGLLGLLSFGSIYLNSLFAAPVYVSGELQSVEYVTNFFFTYTPPIDIPLTETWHWYVYLAVLLALAVLLIGILYLPFFIQERSYRKKISAVRRQD